MTRGLVIGKFLPPHAGHFHLIESARRLVDELSVVLFTKTSEPIPARLRHRWMTILFPGVSILHVTEEHAVDFGDPGVWRLWIDAIHRAHPANPDVVFSSETYGDELARRLAARHVLVDLERRAVPLSGTRVRRPFLAEVAGRWDDQDLVDRALLRHGFEEPLSGGSIPLAPFDGGLPARIRRAGAQLFTSPCKETPHDLDPRDDGVQE